MGQGLGLSCSTTVFFPKSSYPARDCAPSFGYWHRLFPTMARKAWAGSMDARNCSQLGEGVDLTINTQKAAKRLQLWPAGCGGLWGLGEVRHGLNLFAEPSSLASRGRKEAAMFVKQIKSVLN